MKIQEIETPRGCRYILLDDEYTPVMTVNRYLKYLDNLGYSRNTLRNYVGHLKEYFTYLRDQEMAFNEIFMLAHKGHLEIFSEYLGLLRESRSNNTSNLMMGTVLGFYEFCHRNGECEQPEIYKRKGISYRGLLSETADRKQVNSSILKLRSEKQALQYATRADYEHMISAVRTIRDKLMLAIMYEGGVRLSEVLGLYVSDIQIWESKIRITPREDAKNGAAVKNRRGGDLYLPKYVMEWISEYVLNERGGYDGNFLFLNISGTNKGCPMSSITIHKLFERISKKIGKRITPHMLRHGHATELHEAGWDVLDIGDRLRHKSVSSTQIYVHSSDAHKRKILREFYERKSKEFEG